MSNGKTDGLMDDAVAVTEEEVLEMRKRLGKEEGLFLGKWAESTRHTTDHEKKDDQNLTLITIVLFSPV